MAWEYFIINGEEETLVSCEEAHEAKKANSSIQIEVREVV